MSKLRPLSALCPNQRQLLSGVSTGLHLFAECRLAACRRAGRCRGYERGGRAQCFLRMFDILGACMGAGRALLPGAAAREPSPDDRQSALAREADEQLLRLQKRMGELVEQEIESLQRTRAAKEGGEGKWM